MTHIKITNLNVVFRKYEEREPSFQKSFIQAILKKSLKKYSFFHAVKGINLEISAGDRLGIIGRSGAGKTTLLKCIAGIYPPTSGEIEINGRIGPLLELGIGFDKSRTARENIYLSGAIQGFSQKTMRTLEDEIIEFSELNEFMDMPLKHFSPGMTSRLAFSIATNIKPEILILDEVFATGDLTFIEKARARMINVIDASKIVLFVSHNKELILQICNKALVMKQGEIAFCGTPDETLEFYKQDILNGRKNILKKEKPRSLYKSQNGD